MSQNLLISRSLSPDSARMESSEFSSSQYTANANSQNVLPSANKYRWFSSEKFGKQHKTEGDFQSSSYSNQQDDWRNESGKSKRYNNDAHANTSYKSSNKVHNGNSSQQTIATTGYSSYEESTPGNIDKPKLIPIKSDFKTDSNGKRSPDSGGHGYDYKEGVLFQTNYHWPDRKSFRDDNAYTVHQFTDKDGFQQTHGKMERETGDKRGIISRETWTKVGKDNAIREENLKFQHTGPICNLPAALPPDSKNKILTSLYGDDAAKQWISEDRRNFKEYSIFPRSLQEVGTYESTLLNNTSSAREDSTRTMINENITEQSYVDERISHTGPPQPPIFFEQRTDEHGNTEKYYRKCVEDDIITYTGDPAYAAATLNAIDHTTGTSSTINNVGGTLLQRYGSGNAIDGTGGYNKYWEKTCKTEDSTRNLSTGYRSDYESSTNRNQYFGQNDKSKISQTTRDSRELNEGSSREETYRKFKIIEDELYSPQQTTTSTYAQKSTATVRDQPSTKHASVQYDIQPSYRVVFEKMTKKERITEREPLDKENVATQTYVPFVPKPEPLPPATDDKFKDLTKSIDDIVLSIKDLNEKIERKQTVPSLPPILPTVTKIEHYEKEHFHPSRDEECMVEKYIEKSVPPPVKVAEKPQKRSFKTRKIKKVRMEEIENLQDYPEFSIDKQKFYYENGSHAAIETGKASTSHIKPLTDGAANDISEALYVKASMDDKPSNSKEEYITYKTRSSRKFDGRDSKDDSIHLPETTSSTKYYDRSDQSNKSHYKEGQMVSDDDEPEIVEVYKKTQTHKHKKVIIKSSESGGVEKIITENIYDPPVVVSHTTTKTATGSSFGDRQSRSQEIGAGKDYSRDKLTVYEHFTPLSKINYSDNWPSDGRYIPLTYERKRMDQERPKYEWVQANQTAAPKISRVISHNTEFIDNDSGIAASSPPYPPSLGTRSSSFVAAPGTNLRYNGPNERITYVPNRFRGSGRNISDMQKVRPQQPQSSYFSGFAPRDRSYQKAWDELSERQSISGDNDTHQPMRGTSLVRESTLRDNAYYPNYNSREKWSAPSTRSYLDLSKPPRNQQEFEDVSRVKYIKDTSKKDYQPDLYVPTVPAPLYASTTILNRRPDDIAESIKQTGPPSANLEKWDNIYRDERYGDFIEEKGTRYFSRSSNSNNKPKRMSQQQFTANPTYKPNNNEVNSYQRERIPIRS